MLEQADPAPPPPLPVSAVRLSADGSSGIQPICRIICADAKKPPPIAPGQHDWFLGGIFSTEICCRKCGVVRRREDDNLPCRGPIRFVERKD